MRLTFFRTPKPRQFEYKPRHYDPEKERREERRKELLGASYPEAGEERGYRSGDYIRNNMGARKNISERREQRRSSTKTIRLAAMLILLAALAWWIFT